MKLVYLARDILKAIRYLENYGFVMDAVTVDDESVTTRREGVVRRFTIHERSRVVLVNGAAFFNSDLVIDVCQLRLYVATALIGRADDWVPNTEGQMVYLPTGRAYHHVSFVIEDLA